MSSEAPRRGRSGQGRSTSEADTPDTPQDQNRSSTADSPEGRARDVIYRLLAVRARSEAELRQALLRKDIDEEVADAVLRKFVDAGLVDDAEFAESWVQQRHEYQGLGRKALRFELRRKGVDDTVVTEALSGMDDDAEMERARELVRRKLRSLSSVDEHVKRRRLVGMLARKGYGEGLSYRVVREEVEREQSGEEAL